MRVLNFGSLNIDYVYSVDHFVRKGETLSSDGMSVYSGGKGLNQSIALSRAGAEVYHAGIIGEDGMFLKEILREAGVDTTYIEEVQAVRTGNAIIQKDKNGDNCILLYGGANRTVTGELIDRVLSHFGRDDLLVLQNEVSGLPYIIEVAHEKGMLIALNPSPINDTIFEIDLDRVDYLLLNEIEAVAIAGEKLEEDLLLDRLCGKFPKISIVLTLGEKGAMYAKGGRKVRQASYRVPVVDTTAAGDTFTGYFLAVLLEGGTVEKALDMAAKASAIAVTKQGAAPSIPERSEVEKRSITERL